MQVSLRAMLIAIALATPAWSSLMAEQGLSIGFVNGQLIADSRYYANGGGPAPAPGTAVSPAEVQPAVPGCSGGVVGAEAACCNDVCMDACDCAPVLTCKNWTVLAGATFLNRNNDREVFLRGPGGGSILGPDIGPQTGFQGSVIRHGDGLDFEVGVLWLVSNSRNDFIDIDPGTSVPGTDLIFAAPGDGFSSYDSELFSAEFNARRRYSDYFTILGGFRYLNLNEELLIGTVDTLPDLGAQTEVDNNLYGFQIGIDSVIYQSGYWNINAIGKAGIYYNDIDRDIVLMGDPIPGTVRVSDDDDTEAFVGQAELSATYWITENFGLRGGYQVIWLDGVALAPAQLRGIGEGGEIDSSSSPFYHGALVQGEFVW